MKLFNRRLIIIVILCCFLYTIFVPSFSSNIQNTVIQASQTSRRKLKVALYPFMPLKDQYFYEVETGFESMYPGIDLEIVDLSENYYNTKKPKAITNTKADVYELDSVFLKDFVEQGKIQALPSEIKVLPGEFLDNAVNGTKIDGTQYGAPHWVCGNFLFFLANDGAFRSVKTLSDLEKVIGCRSNQSLFVDLKGKSTLGEFYLDAAFDRYASLDEIQPHLVTFDENIKNNLKRIMFLCDKGYCRSDKYHDIPGFYARQFARKRSRAYIGYSESLFYLLSESQLSCSDEDSCLTDTSLDVVELPLDEKGSHQISWVDMFVIDKESTTTAQKEDSIAFIQFVNSEEFLLKTLMPRFLQPARYLLPARASLYTNSELIKQVPLYPKLKTIIEKANTPTGKGLNDTLRSFGQKIDENL